MVYIVIFNRLTGIPNTALRAANGPLASHPVVSLQTSSDGCLVCGLSVSSSSLQDGGVWLLVARTAHAANAAPIALELTQRASQGSDDRSTRLQEPGGTDQQTLTTKKKSWLDVSSAKTKTKGSSEEDDSLRKEAGGKVLSSSVSVTASASCSVPINMYCIVISVILVLSHIYVHDVGNFQHYKLFPNVVTYKEQEIRAMFPIWNQASSSVTLLIILLLISKLQKILETKIVNNECARQLTILTASEAASRSV